MKIKVSYQPMHKEERETAKLEITTDHSMSSYGQPVAIAEDGEALSTLSLVGLDYQLDDDEPAEAKKLWGQLMTHGHAMEKVAMGGIPWNGGERSR